MKKLTPKNLLYLLLSVVYVAGLVVMFFDFPTGVVIWAAAFLPSFIVFMYDRRRESLKSEQEARQTKEDAELVTAAQTAEEKQAGEEKE
ncbi:MAG: hypothetical protein IKR85_02220 [Clostridia bacterium]|nr:hypothetical protein [Clostridia bacterium]